MKLVSQFLAFLSKIIFGQVVYHEARYLFSVTAEYHYSFTIIEATRTPLLGKTVDLLPYIFVEYRDKKRLPHYTLFQMSGRDVRLAAVWSEYNAFTAAAELNIQNLCDLPDDVRQNVEFMFQKFNPAFQPS